MMSKMKLKEQMQATNDLSDIVDVMKQVASTQLRQLEGQHVRFELFSSALREFFYWMNVKDVKHPFFRSEAAARLIVLITSDAGFLGGLNTAITDEGFNGFDRKRGDAIAVIGDRGRQLLEDIGCPAEGTFPGISAAIGREEIHAVEKLTVEGVLAKRFGSVTVVYPHYFSITRQAVSRFELFPCRAVPQEDPAALERVPTPVVSLKEQFLLESPLEAMIAFLVEQWTSERLYSLFWHSKLSELAARMFHLEESQQELSSEKKQLSAVYVKIVHEETDRSIREIVSGRTRKEKERC